MTHGSPKSEHLYEITVETLELPESVLKVIKRTGITSIGDCLDHFLRGKDAIITTRDDFIEIMETQIREKLGQRGYLNSDQ